MRTEVAASLAVVQTIGHDLVAEKGRHDEQVFVLDEFEIRDIDPLVLRIQKLHHFTCGTDSVDLPLPMGDEVAARCCRPEYHR